MMSKEEEDSVSLYASDDENDFLLCVPPSVLSNRSGSGQDGNLDFCKRLMTVFPSSFFFHTSPIAATTTHGGTVFTHSSTQQRYDADIRRIKACSLRMLFAAFSMVEGGSYGDSSAIQGGTIPPPLDYTLITVDDLQSYLIDLFRPKGDLWKDIILTESDCTAAATNAPLITQATANSFVPHIEHGHTSHNDTFRFYPKRLKTVPADEFYNDIFGLNNVTETHPHTQQDHYYYPPFLHLDNSIKLNNSTATSCVGVIRNASGAVMETAYDCLTSLSRQVDQMILRFTDEGKLTTKFWIQNLHTGYSINNHLSFQFFPIGKNALEMIQNATTSAALAIYPRRQTKMIACCPFLGSNTNSRPNTLLDPAYDESIRVQEGARLHEKQHSKVATDSSKPINCSLENDDDDDSARERKPLKRLRRGIPLVPYRAPSVTTTVSCSTNTLEVSLPHTEDELKYSTYVDMPSIYDSVQQAWAVADNHYNFSDLEQLDSISRTASSEDDGW